MRQRLRSIIRKEFIQALRDPRMRSMLLIPPLLQLLVFGYAVNLDVDTATIALWLGHESVETTQMYLDADLALKEKALARTTPPKARARRYRPGDRLLDFLKSL